MTAPAPPTTSTTGKRLHTAALAAGWTVRVTPGHGTLPVLDPDRPTNGDGVRPDVWIDASCQSEAVRLIAPDGRRAVALFVTTDGESWTGAPFRVHWPGKDKPAPCNAWTWTPGTTPTPIGTRDLLALLQSATAREDIAA